VISGPDLGSEPSGLPESWTADRLPLHLETSVPGVFAAGDVRAGSTKQLGSALGEGVTAVMMIRQYLQDLGDLAARPSA
jgi:thioredoxin reductase (NADPH)